MEGGAGAGLLLTFFFFAADGGEGLELEGCGVSVFVMSTWPSSCWPATSNSTVCSRVLPVSQLRHVLRPLGIATDAINQTVAMLLQSMIILQPHSLKQNAYVTISRKDTLFVVRFPNSNTLLRLVSALAIGAWLGVEWVDGDGDDDRVGGEETGKGGWWWWWWWRWW